MTAPPVGETRYRDVAAELASQLDPVAFARRCGLEPDPYQVEILHSTARQVLLNLCRQSGKSTMAAVLAAHLAVYSDGTTSLIVAPSQRQAGEALAKVRALVRHVVRPEQESESRIVMPNGSRVIALPGGEGGHNLRGFSIDLLTLDEASRVSEEVYAAVRPALAARPGARLLAMSTPNGMRGWWAEAWHEGGTAWERIKVTADECPRITAEFLANERVSLGENGWRQEYYGEFRSSTGAVFSSESIEAAFGGRSFA